MSIEFIKKDVLRTMEKKVNALFNWPKEIEWRTEAPGESESPGESETLEKSNSKECVLVDGALDEELMKGNYTWKIKIGLQLRANAYDRKANEFSILADAIEQELLKLKAKDFPDSEKQRWHCYRMALVDRGVMGKDEDLYLSTWGLEGIVHF